MRARLNEIMAEATGQTLAKINSDVERDFILNAEQAKEYGVVDEIIYKKQQT
jgi:ATP-dependent Clp protease protease subunit